MSSALDAVKRRTKSEILGTDTVPVNDFSCKDPVGILKGFILIAATQTVGGVY